MGGFFASHPSLVKPGIIAAFALFGLFDLVWGWASGSRLEAVRYQLACYLGSAITGIACLVGPSLVFACWDPTWGIAMVLAVFATIALGLGLSGNAIYRDRYWG